MSTTQTVQTISTAEAAKLLEAHPDKCVLLDVRTPAEFETLHARNAQNTPLHTLTPESVESLKEKQILCICQKGARGLQAAEILLRYGYTNICNIQGGTEAWHTHGLPVVKGKSSISLERQVRIAAGTLVILGVLGGFFLSPYAYGLSLFVGCGLVFAGITDTCGMAMILGRCPWNTR